MTFVKLQFLSSPETHSRGGSKWGHGKFIDQNPFCCCCCWGFAENSEKNPWIEEGTQQTIFSGDTESRASWFARLQFTKTNMTKNTRMFISIEYNETELSIRACHVWSYRTRIGDMCTNDVDERMICSLTVEAINCKRLVLIDSVQDD